MYRRSFAFVEASSVCRFWRRRKRPEGPEFHWYKYLSDRGTYTEFLSIRSACPFGTKATSLTCAWVETPGAWVQFFVSGPPLTPNQEFVYLFWLSLSNSASKKTSGNVFRVLNSNDWTNLATQHILKRSLFSKLGANHILLAWNPFLVCFEWKIKGNVLLVYVMYTIQYILEWESVGWITGTT